MHPGHQFPDAKRFGDVVISPQGQTADLVVPTATRGEHEDVAVREGADPSAYLQAVEFGQPQIQHHNIGGKATGLVHGLGASVRLAGIEAGPEVTTLAQAFNTMADRLEHTEQVRRQMLSDLAHEMGTPLSVLMVYLDGLQDGVVDWNNATHTIMADQLTRLTRLMEDIDDVSRAQEHRIDLELVEEGLGDLLHTAAAAAGEAYADKGVDLQVETITDTARVLVDRQRFGQVMSNLLSNALRHTPAGGQVRISVHRQGASTALIHVADDGEGIPPDQLGHIFERFYRGDAARSRDDAGAGIGLTISRALIEAHGGTLTATSPGPGRGAVFALRLPLSPPDSEEAAR